METMRRISKRYYLRQMVIWLLVNVMFFGLPFGALAMPTGGNVVAGTADITDPHNMLIDGQAVINWTGFNTTNSEWVGFDKMGDLGGRFAVLNRISGGATSFMGDLYGHNGLVILSNPSGIVFGPYSCIQARSFAAIGFDINPDDFMAKGLNFDPLDFSYGSSTEPGYICLDKSGSHRATIEVSETLALIGKNITNKGRICVKEKDAYVVMAAGETVLISRENSHVNVDVTSSGDNENWVKNEGDLRTNDADGKVSLVLAAGDIYSTAIDGVESLRAKAIYDAEFDGDIDVEATPGSDAVAEVDIITGNSLTIDHDITATATGNGVDDATASISLKSEHGNVDIKGGYHSDTEVAATAKDGANNTAKVSISAPEGDVRIVADKDVEVMAKASNKLDEDDLSEDGVIEGLTNTATVDIAAGGSVEIRGEGKDDAIVKAIARNEIDIDPEIPALEDDESFVTLGLTIQDLTNTATINISGDSVEVEGLGYDSGAKATVEASASNEMKVDIENFVEDEAPAAVVNLDVLNLQNDAGVTIAANGKECEINAEVEGDEGHGLVRAEAYNTLEVEHQGYWTKEKVYWGCKSWQYNWVDVYHPVAPATLNLTVEGLANNANVDMSSASGDVVVRADEAKRCDPYTAGVEAEAYNEFDLDHLDETTTGNLSFDDIVNTAGIGIKAGENVYVLAEDGGRADVAASAWNGLDVSEEACGSILGDNITNKAGVDITAVNGDVEVKAECSGASSEAGILASAYNEGDLSVDGMDSEPENMANTANVDISAGDDVKVIGKDGGVAEIAASAEEGKTNTADVAIDAGGDVKVIAACCERSSEASITAETSCGLSNTSTIDIAAVDDVLVIGKDGGEAEIAAGAERGQTNTADVAIDAGGDVKVIAACCERSSEASITAEAEKGCENNASVELGGPGHKIGGDVLVLGKEGGEAEIAASAEKGNTNTADVLICTEGKLEVLGKDGGDASVAAEAGKGEFNTARVGIGAVEGISVMACGYRSDASIAAEAEKGYSNQAEIIACTKGDVLVLALNGGEAEIATEAKDGYFTDAQTAVCATGNIIVAAADFGQSRCDTSAEISAEAEGKGFYKGDGPTDEQEPSTANAAVNVVSEKGGVIVAAVGCGEGGDIEAGITSKAKDAELNTAYTGVAAGSKLSPASTLGIEDIDWESFEISDLSGLLAGDILVGALGNNSKAKISSIAVDGYKNDAMTVLCAPGKVVVAGAFGGEAKIFSGAFGGGENNAETKVYAGGGEIGTDIFSDDVVLLGDATIKAVTSDGFSGYCVKGSEVVFYEYGTGAKAVVGTYASRDDCPECPPCPCEEGEEPGTPAAPLYTEAGEPLEPQEFEQGGCPALMQWFADEVGLPLDQIHVMLSNADFLATDIQPCEACARLKQQSDAMASVETAQIDAWASTVRAGLVGPITPEMMDGIRTALADNPAAMGFDEAAAQYVKILTEELGFEQADAVAVMTGHYAPNDSDLGAYIGARTGM